MTLGTTVGTLLALAISLGSLVVAILAYRRTAASDALEREAIIAVSMVWSQQHDPRWTMPNGADLPDANPRPSKPSQTLVIAANPTITEDIVVREENLTEKNDADRTGYASHRIMLAITNVGRSAATGVSLRCSLTGTYLRKFHEGVKERTFVDRVVDIDVLAPNVPCFVEIRNLPSVPIVLSFEDVRAEDATQPIRLAGTVAFSFHPRA